MDLTDSFTWEDLPTRDADTGHLTAAGWIPLTLKYSRNAIFVIFCFHYVQSTIRIVKNHETVFPAWYPFDWTVSPFYELVNISQVTFSINLRRQFSCLNCSYDIATAFKFRFRAHGTEFSPRRPFKSLRVFDNKRLYIMNQG
jgi:hypothetical protein